MLILNPFKNMKNLEVARRKRKWRPNLLKMGFWEPQENALRMKRKVERRPDMKYPEKVERRPNKILDARYREKAERWPDRIPDVRCPDGWNGGG